MKHKLLSFFENSIEQQNPPSPIQLTEYYWFKLSIQDGWIGIVKSEIDESQLDLLKACYDFFQPDIHQKKEAFIWNQYLYFHGDSPNLTHFSSIRMVQFQMSGDTIEKPLIESAFNGFISSKSLLVWNGQYEGVIIEAGGHFLEEDEYQSLAHALQSDFFITTNFYIGKEIQSMDNIPMIFSQERNIFSKGLLLIPSKQVLTLEIILPNLLISRLLEDEIELFKEWFSILGEDKELLLTIQTFIENNGHSTNTAKQLFIHRNTLQYRLDKFTEKTGIQLKSYNTFFITYLACLLFSNRKIY